MEEEEAELAESGRSTANGRRPELDNQNPWAQATKNRTISCENDPIVETQRWEMRREVCQVSRDKAAQDGALKGHRPQKLPVLALAVPVGDCDR